MQQKDTLITAVIGLLTGLSGVFLLKGLGIITVSWAIFVIVPVISILGFLLWLYIGLKLTHYWPGFAHFTRFVIIGFSNAAIDFGLLNILISASGIVQGIYFSLFKTLGFLAALINSYVWNRYWTFQAQDKKSTREFVAFTAVVCVSLFINVGISSLIVNYIPPLFGLSLQIWVNLASVSAVSIGLFWNFIGMKLFVFKAQRKDMLMETL